MRSGRPAGSSGDLTRSEADHGSVVVRPGAWFVASSLLSPTALVVLGGWGLIAAGRLAVLPLGMLVLGAVLGTIVLVDLPLRSVLSPAGVVRVCPLRRQRLAWDDVVAVSRTRVDHGPQRLVGRAVAGDRGRKGGGLVLEVGPKRRRHLLADRPERPDQYDELRRLVPAWAPGVSVPAPPR